MRLRLRNTNIIGLALLIMSLSTWSQPGSADPPFKLQIQEQGYVPQQAYPSPEMVNTNPPLQGGTSLNRPMPPMNPMQGGAMMNQPLQRVSPPMQATVRQVILPNVFLGAWIVNGQRTKVEAQPEFANAAQSSFAQSTSNIWQIVGGPQGYALNSNSGASMPLIVDKVEGQTAFIRYQHPIGNTMAQEAIVMQLVGGNLEFNGLERISIVKQGMPEPRARVTYKLMGQRQR